MKKIIVLALVAVAAVFAACFDMLTSVEMYLAIAPAVISTDRMRFIWDLLKEKSKDANFAQRDVLAKAFEDWRIQPGILRLEAPLNANATSYAFPILKENSLPSVTEKRLDRSDTFFVAEHGVLLALTPTAERSRQKLYSYNAWAFENALNVTGLKEDLLAIYNGQLNITLDQKQVLQEFDMNQFLRRPDGCNQDGAGQVVDTTSLDNGVTTYNYLVDRYQDSGSPLAGVIPVTPLLNYNGTAKNQITVSFPKDTGISFAPANGYEMALIYYAVGYRLAGANVNL